MCLRQQIDEMTMEHAGYDRSAFAERGTGGVRGGGIGVQLGPILPTHNNVRLFAEIVSKHQYHYPSSLLSC